MKSWITRSLVAVMLAIVTTLGSIAPASAATRATLKAAATAVAYETVGGPNYAKYKALYPSSLNWGNDGCSVPSYIIVAPGLAAVLNAYGQVFVHSCDRHDFGYRNFGKNTTTPGVHQKFSPTRATKDKIDSKFYANMKVNCDASFGNPVTRGLCKSAAWTFYTAVKERGDKAFFG